MLRPLSLSFAAALLLAVISPSQTAPKKSALDKATLEAYVRHLFLADEILGLRLLSLHNVHFLVELMRTARTAILDGSFDQWSADWLLRYHSRTTTSV